MKRVVPWFGPVLWWILGASAALGAGPDVNRIVAGIQETYARVQDLQADFVQEVWLPTAGTRQESRGVVYLRKPDRMRWETREPSRQVYVVSGRVAWHYDVQARQATRQRLPDDPRGTPASFLRDMSRLTEDFQVAFASASSPTGPEGRYLLRLTPRRPMGSLEKVVLEVEPRSFRVVRFTLHDATGNVTTVRFSRIRFNPGLPDRLFRFVPPQGVEVLELP